MRYDLWREQVLGEDGEMSSRCALLGTIFYVCIMGVVLSLELNGDDSRLATRRSTNIF